MNFKYVLIFFLFLIFFIVSEAQVVCPLNREMMLPVENALFHTNGYFHSSIKPYIESNIKTIINTDSLFDFSTRDSAFINRSKHPCIWKKLRRENLFFINTDDFSVSVNPLFDFEFGREKHNSINHYINTRGGIIKGVISKRFYFQSLFCESQTIFPNYLKSFIDSFKIIPGQGRAKKFKTNGYDYSVAEGLISYSPINSINLQLGHGKFFIGDGYRSLFLSDNSFNYPFLKISYFLHKIQYNTIYAVFQDMNFKINPENAYQKKYATIHYLSYNFTKKINLGLFQSTVWQSQSLSQNKKYNWYCLNPLIFTQPAFSGLNSIDNTMIGISINGKVFRHLQLYSQYVIDDIKKNKSINDKRGYQVGVKYFNVGSIKNLYLQCEYNRVRPYMYAHYNALQSYTHYNQPLAHPFGANFIETIGIINYRIKDFLLEWKINYSVFGADTSKTHYGKNIFISDFYAQNGINSTNNKVTQGEKTYLTFLNFTANYLINPKTNFNIIAGVTYRNENNSVANKKILYFYFGIKTSIVNYYYDM